MPQSAQGDSCFLFVHLSVVSSGSHTYSDPPLCAHKSVVRPLPFQIDHRLVSDGLSSFASGCMKLRDSREQFWIGDLLLLIGARMLLHHLVSEGSAVVITFR